MQRRQRQTLITAITATIGLTLILVVGWFYLRQYRTFNYKNARYGFALKYPAYWSMTENAGGTAAIFYSPLDTALDTFQENVNIVVQDISAKPMSLEEYTEKAISQMQLVFGTNLEILDSSPTFLAGRDGHQFIFIGKGPDLKLQYLCVWTLAGTTAYQVTYTAMAASYAKHLGEAKRIIGSFRIQ